MNNKEKPVIALTMGDVTGIGPEIVAKVVLEGLDDLCRVLVVDNAQILRLTFARLGASLPLPMLCDVRETTFVRAPVTLLDLTHAPSELLALGRPHPEAGRAAVEALSKAFELVLAGQANGVVFAPLCKEVLHQEERTYSDELDLFRELTNSPQMARVVKVGKLFRISVTGHIALREVPDLITRERVLASIELLHETLQVYGVVAPRLAVAALNPHGGEHGLFGQEEIEQIEPAVQAARAAGINVQGPLPADIIFVRAFRSDFDGVVNLYHDQGNIAVKVARFGEGVVLYVRSPVIVTTTGHGTAFDIAEKGVANPNNFREAIKLAVEMAERRRKS